MPSKGSVVILNHPLLRHSLSLLRDKRTGPREFREELRRVSRILATEVTRDLPLAPRNVATPLARARAHAMKKDVVIVPVLRAGLGLVEGFLDILPHARVGHLGMYRNESTLQPVEYYSNLPRSLAASILFLLDPMLATGGSGVAAIAFLKRRGARDIRLVSVVAAPEGIRHVHSEHGDVKVYTCAVDRGLNGAGYIVPGLGDAGDRQFGTV